MKKKIIFIYLAVFACFKNSYSQGGETAAAASGNPITIPFNAQGTTVGKVNDYNNPNGFFSFYTSGPDWLYYFCPTNTNTINIILTFTPNSMNGPRPSISVWQGVPGVGSLVTSAITNGQNSPELGASFKPSAGVCYYLMIDNQTLPIGFPYSLSITNPPSPILQPSCTNMGFENNNFNGWIGGYGNTVSIGNQGDPTPGFVPSNYNTTTNQHAITSGTGTDPYGGFPVVCPGLGSNSLRLGTIDNNINIFPMGYPANGGSMIEQKFSVTASNALFTYHYAVVVEDGNSTATAHASHEQPFFKAEIFDCNNNVIGCGQYLVAGGSGIPGFVLAPGSTTVYYKNWTSTFVDLTNFIGQCVSVRFTVADCSYGGHFCYAYVDAVCAPAEISGPTFICPNASTNLTAPAGGTSYSWTISGSATVIGTNQILNVSPTVMTKYNCKITNESGCISSLDFTIDIHPTPTVTATSGSVCAGLPGTMVATGLSNGIATNNGTYSWSPSNSTGPTLTLSPTVNTTYTVTYTDVNLCKATATAQLTINPIPVVTVNSTTICPSNTAVLIASGATSYTWAGTTNVTNSHSVTPTTTTTYTVTGTTNGCSSSAIATVTVVNNLDVTVNSPTICAGTPVTLTATGATNFSWVNSANVVVSTGNTYSPSPATTSTYTVTGTTNGCSDIATAIVTVKPIPTTTAGSNSSICEGTPLNLTATASNGSTYFWNGPGITASNSTAQNPTIPISTVANTGTYSVTITADGCSSTSSTNVLVKPIPTTISSVNTPCVGSPLELTATSSPIVGASYNWTGPGITPAISTSQNPIIPISSTTDAGIYIVTISADGCTSTHSTTAVIKPIPTTIPTSNAPICAGNTLNLFASSSVTNSTFSWTGPAITASNSALQNPSISDVQVSDTGSYSVTVSSLGCSSTSTLNVDINPGPLAIPNVNSICEGETLNLTAATSNFPNTNYSWSGPAINSTNAFQQNPTIANASVSNSGTYSLTVSSNGCSSTADITAIVKPIPTTILGVNSPICAGTTLNLTASFALTGASYSWSGPGITANVSANQNPTIANAVVSYTGNYVVMVSKDGCSSTSQISAVINPIPTTTVNSTPICLGKDLYLTASNSLNGASFTWTGPGINSSNSNVQNPVITNAVASDAGLYTATVSLNGCSSQNSTTATVQTPITPIFSPLSPICANSIAPILPSLPLDGNEITGTWEPSIISNVNSGIYHFIPNNDQCALPSSLSIEIIPLPILPTPVDGIICAPGTINIAGPSTTPGATGGILSYWMNSSCTIPLDNPYEVSTSGIYYIKNSTQSNPSCEVIKPVKVTINPLPISSFSPSPKELYNTNAYSQMINNSSGGDTYIWSFGDGQTSELFAPDHLYTDLDITNYTVSLTVINSITGCTDVSYETILIKEELLFYVPNTFTPDTDDYNEEFLPIFTSGFDPQNYLLLIYNRWGELIFESHDSAIGWKGLYGKDGTKVQDGTYTWKIKFNLKNSNEDRLVVGHVNILR
jgi:gliding motility-associated-like protein